MTPKLNMVKSHHAIQSSANGTIYVQDGWVFDEGGRVVGEAPPWGPHLFVENGHAIDPHAKVLNYAKEKPFIEQLEPVGATVPLASTKADDVDDMVDEDVKPEGGVLVERQSMPEMKRKPGRPRKESNGSGYGSGPV